MNPSPSSRQGMVLFELIIALSLFTTVAFSLILALDSALTAEKQRLVIDTAVRGMENQLTLMHATPISPTDKDLPDDGSGVSYHLIVEPEQLKDQKNQPLRGFYRATITARWKLDNSPNERTLTALFFQP